MITKNMSLISLLFIVYHKKGGLATKLVVDILTTLGFRRIMLSTANEIADTNESEFNTWLILRKKPSCSTMTGWNR